MHQVAVLLHADLPSLAVGRHGVASDSLAGLDGSAAV